MYLEADLNIFKNYSSLRLSGWIGSAREFNPKFAGLSSASATGSVTTEAHCNW